ncbi:MAG: hypothetical protein GY719_19955 [bacterium]|nr:hypothetical protein [bacterium]
MAGEKEARKSAYSIRFVLSPGGRCAACGSRDTGNGPVAYRGEEPICDPCALEACAELGLVLALIAVIRAYATASERTHTDSLEALRELGAFARIYEHVAVKTGPPRILHLDRQGPS